MTKFLILHGTSASPQDNWFMWLKGKLIGQGHEVWLPQLPNCDKPNIETYNSLLLHNKDFSIDENTIIIGHSSGAVAILGLLEALPKEATIKAAILVSAFKDDLGWDSLVELFQKPFDFDLITPHCNLFLLIHSNNDPHVPITHAEYLSDKLHGKMIVMENQGHFNTKTSPDYKQFPELLAIIESTN